MIIDFFQQILYTAIFFLGIAGVGIAILKLLKYESGNILLRFSVAFFVSLCFFIITAVGLLFVVPGKLLSLEIFSSAYFLASFLIIFCAFKEKAKNVGNFLKSNWLVFLVLLAGIFFFFLQLYHTSILDEYLHRPVVKFFTTNGIFPLENPLAPGSNFIYTYHYGSELISSAIQLLSRIGVSESLDIFKMSFFAGGFFLFYGIILKWSNGKKWYAALGAFISLFCGASFFFVDGFTTDYLHKIKVFEQLWTMNAPFSFGICSITGIGNFLAVAFVVLIEDLFYRKNNFSVTTFAILSLLFAGFFLLGELFATISLACLISIVLYKIIKRKINIKNILAPTLVFVFLLSAGIYLSGGVVGSIVKQKWQNVITEKFNNKESVSVLVEEIESGGDVSSKSSNLFSLRDISNWGYASQKETMKVQEHPFFYLRNFFLEIILFAIFIWAFVKKKIRFGDNPLMFSLAAVCIAAPFFFSTSWGDLNFYKLTVFGLMLLHLLAFYLFAKIKSKILFAAVLVLFAFGVIPGMLQGVNIQWRFFSGKGGEVYCSQNPLCYTERAVKFLSEFEKQNPGIKVILTEGGDAKKIIDLTNSYAVNIEAMKNLDDINLAKNGIDYAFFSPSDKGKFIDQYFDLSGRYPIIKDDGFYKIIRIK